MPFTGIHDEDMQHQELLEHYGPVYGVPLAIENAEAIAEGRATEMEAKLLEIINDSKDADPRRMQMCKVCLGDGDHTCPKCGGSGYE